MGLVYWMPCTSDNLFNQGLSDAQPTNNDTTVNVNGKLGKCRNFSGGAQWIDTNYKESFNNGDFALAAWIKLDSSLSSSKTYQPIITNKTTSSVSVGCAIYFNHNQQKFLWSTADGSASTEIWTSDTFTDIYDKWIHIVMVRNNSDLRKGYFYIDGVRKEIASVPVIRNVTNNTYGFRVGALVADNETYRWTGDICDVRVYDCAISAKEAKELSKGLVLHYTLSENIQTLNNCYSSPTFNPNSTGWGHWGDTGHVGTFGQSTDKTYIYYKDYDYCHWVANGSDATKNYLLYQSPAFDGGYRSLQCICKEENGAPITEDICFPAWNARNGGVASNTWTSIISLGNGFYLCKCEGISQDGSNDLVGIYIRAGYKVYFSECYLENDRTICSDIIFPSDVIYDVSGYNYNGMKAGSLTCSSNTARYCLSTVFNTNTDAITIAPCYSVEQTIDSMTCTIWFKTNTLNSTALNLVSLGGNSFFRFTMASATSIWYCIRVGPTQCSNTFTCKTLTDSVWHHIAVVFNKGYVYVYLDGSLIGTGDHTNTATYMTCGGITWLLGGYSANSGANFIALFEENGAYLTEESGTIIVDEATTSDMATTSSEASESDFRIYATALSADDILELYNTSASISENGVVFTRELREV